MLYFLWKYVIAKDNVSVLGVDEIAWHKGLNYLTLVYQIDAGMRRLLWIGENRTKTTMKTFFTNA